MINSKQLEFSFVIPAFNEEQSLDELVRRISEVVRSNWPGSPFEIVFVDDGSTDSTWRVINRLREAHPLITGIRMRRNFGKSLALMAGFKKATGRFVVTMDADLQDNPEDLPTLIKKLNEGYDLVGGWRQNRQDTFIRKIGSRLVNFFTYKVSGLKARDLNCGFKVYRGEIIKKLFIYGQLHRFIPLQAHLMGFRVAEAPIANSERKYGESKYRAFRYQGLFDLMSLLFTFKYAHSPLHFFGLIGFAFIIPSSMSLTYFLGKHVLYWAGFGEQYMLFNRPLLSLFLVSFMIGVVILLTGFVCDFILHHHTRNSIDVILALSVDASTGDDLATHSRVQASGAVAPVPEETGSGLS